MLCRAATSNQIHVFIFHSLTTYILFGLGLGCLGSSTIAFLPIMNAIYRHDNYTGVVTNSSLLSCVSFVVVGGTLPLIHASEHMNSISAEGDID
jgi:hypothetical protein